MASYLGLSGPTLRHAILWLIVCPSFMCYGYNLSVAGGLLTLESFVSVFPQLDTLNTKGDEQRYNSTIQGTVVALFNIGGIFGALSCIYLGDVLGRKRVILITSIISIIGVILMFTSFQLAQFVIARLVLGFGNGGAIATVPVWQAEISKTKKRGAHVVTSGIFMGIGVSLALWVDFGLYFVKDSSIAWRFPLAFQLIFLLPVAIFIPFLPESPRWLIKRDRKEEAGSILAVLDRVDAQAEVIRNEIQEIEASLALCVANSWTAIFTMGKQRLFHRMMLALAAGIFQQINGINLISIYATTIFEQYLNLNPINARILAAAMCMMQILGGYLAFYTIDRLGRRPLMLWSAGGMSICMALLAGTTSVTNNTAALVVAVISLFAFQFIFTVGYAGMTFLYATEIAPLQLRAAISAISTAAIWTFGFLLAEVTPIGFNTIQYRYYLIFAVINAAIIPTVYFFFPETSGRSLEEIDEIFMQSKTIWDPPKVARVLPYIETDRENVPTVSDEEKN